MTTFAIVLALIAIPAALISAVVTMPRWCVRTLYRHRIWLLRDTVMDDVIYGRLPRDHACVQHLLKQTESAARDGHRVTMVDMYAFQKAAKKNPKAAAQLRAMYRAHASKAGLSAEQKAQVAEYERKFQTLVSGMMVLGSWFGLTLLARQIVPSVITEMRRRRADRRAAREEMAGPWKAVTVAADAAVEGTEVGQRAIQWNKERELLAAL